MFLILSSGSPHHHQ